MADRCCMAMDYGGWCFDEQTILDEDTGLRYCIFHLPASKGTQSYLFNEQVFKKIRETDNGEVCDLSGTIFDRKIDFSAKFKDLGVLPEINFNYAVFEDICLFDDLQFENLNLEWATFKTTASFQNTSINGKLYLNQTVFNDSVWFDDSIFNEVDFYGSEFLKELTFINVIFKKNLELENVTCKGQVDFNGSTFKDLNINESVIFSGDVYFNSSCFEGDIRIVGTHFERKLIFEEAKFRKNLIIEADTIVSGSFVLSNAELYANIEITECIFEKGVYLNDLDVYSCENNLKENDDSNRYFKFESNKCNGPFEVDSAVFNCETSFDGTDFRGAATFSSFFNKSCSFQKNRFRETVFFDDTRFSGSVYFADTFFLKRTVFKAGIRTAGPAKEKDGVLYYNIEEKRVRVFDENNSANFSNVFISEEVIFIGANLKKVLFHSTDLSKINFIDCTFQNKGCCFIFYDELLMNKLFDKPKSTNNSFAEGVESLYRSSKQKSIENHNWELVSNWHYREKTIARKKYWNEGKIAKYCFNWLYWIFSGYNERPFNAIVVFIFFTCFLGLLIPFDVVTVEDWLHRLVNGVEFFPFVSTIKEIDLVSLQNEPVRRFILMLVQIALSIQLALVIMSVRNKLRR